MNRKIFCVLSLFVLWILNALPAPAAETSQVIPFSGTISGQPDGDIALRFRLFPAATGGTSVFEETQTVTVSAEAFSVLIGNATSGGIPPAIFASNPSLWIAFALDSTPDAEIGDRTSITANGYAFKAVNADQAAQATAAQTAQTATSAQTATTFNAGASVTASQVAPLLTLTNNNSTGQGLLVNVISGNGIESRSISGGFGVIGQSNTFVGVYGKQGTGTNRLIGPAGTWGDASTGFGVLGTSTNSVGVFGSSRDGFGGYFESNGGISLAARGNGTNVLLGDAGCGAPTAAIGFGTLGQCRNFALGASPVLNETVINRPLGGQISFRESNGPDQMRIAPGGNVGVGTSTPTARLAIRGNGTDVLLGDAGCPPPTAAIGFGTMSGCNNFALGGSRGAVPETVINRPRGGTISFREGNGVDQIRITSGGNVGIGTLTPGSRLDVNGLTTTKVLQITGGADLSEQFEVHGASPWDAEGSDAPVQPGMVVSIDVKNPGKLVVSRTAYDRRVAGIISGAGGVKPGMLMGQSGTLADGDHPVALSGRVYVRADASNGSIVPGDLLTTSDVPGHAMKVMDHAKAQGAIIGKAMTGLAKGNGLVLVLVTLQ